MVELGGDELEDLIEGDGPVDSYGPAEPYAETQAIQLSDEERPPSLQATGGQSLQTGPGMMQPREKTERVRSDEYVSPSADHSSPAAAQASPSRSAAPSAARSAAGSAAAIDVSLHKARTADLRRDGAPPRKRSTRNKRSTTGDGIDSMLGEVLGSYRILSLVGEGGMGRVYMAEHQKLGRKVALKLLRPEYAVKRDAVARFFQEARAVNTIGHENIVDITDFVELDTGETYFIMEMLQGDDLADLQRGSDQPMPLHRAMMISLQVCDALEAAHRSGIVHRDLKPDNIFIVNEGNKRDFVKLLDFGVAKLLDNDESDDGWQTAAGAVIGTPAYMSPEQASGIPVDHRSDVYSLGAILYELFTGHPVFRAKSFGEFVVKHMNDDPIPPRDLADAPSIPSALEQVILRCLEKDPQRRYQSVVDLREDLARATATVETVIHAQALPPAEKPRSKGRRVGLFVTLGLLIAALAAGAFWVASGGFGVDDDNVAVEPGGDDPGAGAGAGTAQVVTAKLTLRSRPGGAKVYRKDDQSIALGRTPLELRLANLGERVDFVFKLKGHKDGEASVVVEDNTVIGVDLEQQRGSSATASASKDPTKRHTSPGVRRARHRPRGRTKRRTTAAPKPATKPATTTKPARKTPKKINPSDVVDPFANP
jgi:eukaryotic-like serine/threonine-protein kinase